MIFKFDFETQGGHTHVTMRTGESTLAMVSNGTLVFNNQEVESFKRFLRRGSGDGGRILIEETHQSILSRSIDLEA